MIAILNHVAKKRGLPIERIPAVFVARRRLRVSIFDRAFGNMAATTWLYIPFCLNLKQQIHHMHTIQRNGEKKLPCFKIVSFLLLKLQPHIEFDL